MKNFFTLWVSFFGIMWVFGQEVCPTLEITDELDNSSAIIDCDYPLDGNQCFEIEASYPESKETTDYNWSTLTFDDSIGFDTGTVVNEGLDDDTWGNAINLPFPFCFYGNTFDQVVISDNGVVSFDTSLAGGTSVFTAATLPNVSLYKNSIYVLYHDLTNDDSILGCDDDPNTAINECGDIRIQTLGTYPCRQFVINYNQINHFGCTSVRSSFQLILHETSNIIDIQVLDKPINCETPNPLSDYRKRATIGILNGDGTMAQSPTGRNAEEFAISNEAYRFSPNGANNTSITWYNGANEIVGNSANLTICSFEDDTYTAAVSYAQCGAEPVVISEEFEVSISPSLPYANDIVISICDALLDDQEVIDLSAYEEAINANNTNFNFSYHLSLAEANNNDNPIGNPTAYLALNNTTIYVRVALNDVCYKVGAILFDFKEPATINPQDFYVCDTGNDGSELVNLDGYNNDLVVNDTDYEIAYYLSQTDAENDTNVQTEITLTGTQTIWIKASDGECYSLESFQLELASIPTANAIDLELCYGITYDLSQHNAEISGNASNVSISFHIFQGQANSGANPVGPIVTINRTRYYVRVEDNISGCYSTTQINIEYVDLSEVENTTLVKCDLEEDEIEFFDLNEAILKMVPDPLDYSFAFYLTQSGAQNQTAAEEIIEPETSNFEAEGPFTDVYVRFVQNASGCTIVKRIRLRVAQLPMAFEDYFFACGNVDDEEDLIYDLSNLNGRIIGNDTQNPNNSVYYTQYYETLEDAENQINQIEEYTVTGIHEIYVRIIVGFPMEDEDGNPLIDEDGYPIYEEICYGIFPITLELSEITNIVENTIITCDDDNDGSEQLDLTSYTGIYTSNPDYTSFRYRKANNNIIANPAAYVVNLNQPLFYLEYQDENMCKVTVEYPIDFIAGPAIENQTIELCDFGYDLSEFINLNDYTSYLIQPTSDYVFSFYQSRNGASNENPNALILNPDNFEVTPDQNTVYIRVDDPNTGCYSVAEIIFAFQEAPALDQDLYVCEYDGNTSYQDYDMTLFNTQLIADLEGYTLTYHTSIEDAQNNVNAVTTSDIFDGQTWYIRITSDLGCIFFLETSITFFQVPELSTNLTICNNNNGENEEIVLSELNLEILSDTADYTFIYYLNEADFNSQTNGLPDTDLITVDENTQLYVHIQFNPVCMESAELHISFLPTIEVQPYTSIQCDLDNNLEEYFDLTEALSELCTDYTLYDVKYFTSYEAADNNDGTFEITQNLTNYFANSEFQLVYVRFTDPTTQCYSIATLTLHISTIPKLVNATTEVCDVNLDGSYDVTLSNLNSLILDEGNADENFTFYYYLDFQDALNGTNEIDSSQPYSNPNVSFSIFIRAENEVGCFSIAEVMITNLPQTEAAPITETIEICDVFNDQQETVDLSVFESVINPDADSYDYFESLEDLQNQSNLISNPFTYSTSAQNSTIYVRVKEEGLCDNYTSFEIILLPSPTSDHEEIVYFCVGENALLEVDSSYAAYLWNDTNETTSSIEVSEEGSYEVTITGSNGCTSSYTIEAVHYENPIVTIHYTQNNEVAIEYDTTNETLAFSLDGINFVGYPQFTHLDNGVHTLYIHNLISDCYYSQEFYIFGGTNVITPNGDGVNDYWKVEDLYFFQNELTQFSVYDRYGKRVYETQTNQAIRWDGKFNGISLPSDTYWYLLELPDGRRFKGWILIKNAH